jgi:hypothetical protein
MAGFAQLYQGHYALPDRYFALVSDAQLNRVREFRAAIRIQLVWRYYRALCRRAREDRMATVIQKRWRKYRARTLVQCLRVEKARESRIAYFTKMATEIQRCWRGYDFRRHVFDYHRQKQYLQRIAEINARMHRELDDHYATTRESEARARAERERRREEGNALRAHHLVSTAAIPSIFQPPAFTKDAEAMPVVENFIRNVNRAFIRKEAKIVVPRASNGRPKL